MLSEMHHEIARLLDTFGSLRNTLLNVSVSQTDKDNLRNEGKLESNNKSDIQKEFKDVNKLEEEQKKNTNGLDLSLPPLNLQKNILQIGDC